MPEENWIHALDRKQGSRSDGQVLARGLTVAEAAELICQYGNVKPYILNRDYGTRASLEERGFEAQ